MTTEDYVSYPIALALKKAGFDWPCISFYRNLDKELWEGGEMNWNNGVDCSAPTLAVAQKWLREVKGFQPEPQYYLDNRWICVIKFLSSGGWKIVNNEDQYFPSYETALSAGIAAAIELIEKKGE